MKNIFLLPNNFKVVGILLFGLGIILTFIRFSRGIKPEFLNQKVFAVYSSFLKSNYFIFTRNNIFEEICGLLVLVGLFFVAFSKEKVETKQIQEIRLYSFFYSIYGSLILALLAFLFIYGLGFIYFSIFNIYLVLLLFILIFKINLSGLKKEL